MTQSNSLQFYSSLIIALVLHVLILSTWGRDMMPKVSTNIPFRVVNIKLTPKNIAPVEKSAPEQMSAEISIGSAASPTYEPEKKQSEINLKKAEETPKKDIVEVKESIEDNIIKEIEQPTKKASKTAPASMKKGGNRVEVVNRPEKTIEVYDNKNYGSDKVVAMASTVPVSVNSAAREGDSYGMGDREKQIVLRYEQLISLWLQNHKMMPAGFSQGIYGEVLVRLQINRAGHVIFYNFEKSSGNRAIDTAVADMVEKSNPFPKVPADYPQGDKIEFLIPVRFNL